MDTCSCRAIHYLTLVVYCMDVSAAVAQTTLPYQSIAVNHIKNDFWRASHSTVLKRERSKTISDFHPSERAIIHPRTRRFRQPAFAKPVYSFQVNEDTLPGSIVGRVETTSAGQQDGITYSIKDDDGDELFTINPNTGEFTLSRHLDYESEQYYILSVSAGHGDEELGIVRVYFNVLDVNDNPPIFSLDAYTVSVLKNRPVGFCILTLNITDADEGQNADIHLTVISGDQDEKFAVSLNGSVCIQKPLDRERESIYSLTIQASDQALPESTQLTSTSHVTVYIEDVNDNAPYFTSGNIVHVLEDTAVNTAVMVVRAIDMDTGANSWIEYTMDSLAGNTFRIDNTSGKLFLVEKLDREISKMFTVQLIATDKGSPPMPTAMNLTVLIVDINDNDPVFTQSVYGVTVDEDVPRGSDLLKVQAFDLDKGVNGQVRYIISQREFLIDSVSGVISVVEKLDRESTPVHTFTVTAVDQGSNPRLATATVNVILSDVNDCTPTFSPTSVTLHLLENIDQLPHIIYQVSAVDEDLDSYSQLTYSISRGHEYSQFSLSPDGTLSVLQSLDREVKERYTLEVLVIDSGLPALTGTGTIFIIIDDLNDNSPVFPKNIYSVVVSEDSPVGTTAATISASDPDKGINGQIRYSLDGGSSHFSIDPSTGDIFTTTALDREIQGHYTLTIKATDMNTTHALSSSASVWVIIEDVNDEPPQFLNDPYVANVPATVHSGTFCEQFADHCASSPCLQGTCANFPTGYTCHCPFGLDGINCEDNSYGFEELSYMELPPLDSRNNVLSLEFATVQQNSLLLYNYESREDSESEFLALEIVDGKVQLSYNLGNGTVKINTEQDIADGNFHTVTASRTGQAGYLKVDSCTDDKPDGFCFSSNEGVGNERTLDVGSNNMVFGGMKSIDPILRRPGQVRTDDFIGCVKNIRLNGVPLEPSQALISHNILDSCPRLHHACENEVCFNGAVCLDFWSFYLCQCTDGFTGPNCGTKISQDSALQLDGESYIDYVIKESYKRSQLVRNQLDSVTNEKKDDISAVEIKFMTRRKEGVLVHIQGHDGSTSVKMVDGKIHYISEDGLSGHVRSVFTEALLSEGQWHLLHLERDRLYTRLILDNKYIMNVTNHTHDFSEINVQSFSLGRIPPGHFRIANEPGFTGCIEYFKYNRKILPFTGFNELVLAQPSHPPVQIGCSSANNCFSSSCSEEASAIPCLSQPCMNGGTCTVLAVGEFYCICPSNFTGPLCESCMSALDRHAVCHKMDLEVPLWIIGVVVPVTVVLLLLVVVILFRLQTKKQSKTSKTLAKDRQGTDNKAFNNDSPCVPIQAVPDASDKQPDIIKAEKKYMTTDEACVQHSNTGQHSMFRCNESELEYYEIESTSSIVLSDTDVIHLSRHTNNYGSKYKTWGEQTQVDLELPTCVDKDSINRNKHCAVTKPSPALPSPYTPRDRRQRSLRPAGVSLHITNLSNEGYHSKLAEPLYSQPIIGRKHVVENIGPPVGLSVEEVKKLNAPRARKQEPKRPPLKVTPRNAELPDWDPRLPAPCIDSSSDGESHSSFTCSEFECERDPSFIRKRQCVYEQAIQCALSDYSEGVDAKTSSPYKDCHLYTSTEVDRCFNPPSLSRNCRWEGLLNLGLQFDRYAAVFEDLAELPIELENVSQLDSDRKSDQEEIF